MRLASRAGLEAVRVRLIGVDWSAVESKRGLAIVDCSGEEVSLVELAACTSRRTALHLISEAMSEPPCLLAIDAPLGWPIALSEALAKHSAGESLPASANEMFSRDTDRFVQRTLKKRPLEVGANFIARTAHSANQFLDDLRLKTQYALPLLWSPEELGDTGVIEVYPAASKITSGSKAAAAALGLAGENLAFANEHVEDALWCAVAALHFIRGECHPPTDVAKNRREGWIWFRRD